MLGLALAFLLALAPALLAWLPGGSWALVGLWQTPLALLPWLALAGFPQSEQHPGPGSSRAALLIACLLPPLALALAADLQSGRTAADLARVAVSGVALVALLALAAGRGRGRRLYAPLWLCAVPGLAALQVAGSVAGVFSRAGAGLARLPTASPLVWCTDALSSGPASAPFGALLVALGLWLSSAWPGRGVEPAE